MIQRNYLVNIFFLVTFCYCSQTVLAYDKAFIVGNPLTENLSKGVYGEDDRKDYYEVKSEIKKVIRSVPAFIFSDHLRKQDNYYFIDQTSFGKKYQLCQDEPFYRQPAASYCSGFMLAPDLIATAGHCLIKDLRTQQPYEVNASCDNISIVFGYHMTDKGENPQRFNASDVYRCKKVIAKKFDPKNKNDYAVIQVDRMIKDRPPLMIRPEGHIQTGSSITSIGYPSGLPIKIAGGATVRSNQHNNFFITDLDTFGGNSGGPVMDTASLMSGNARVEGILVRGATDFVRDTTRDCTKTSLCGVQDAANKKCDGEEVTHISKVKKYAKLIQTRPTQLMKIKARNSAVQFGEELKIDLTLPKAGYLNVIEVNPEGQYTLLYPNAYAQNNQVQAGRKTITDAENWKLQILSGPYGNHQLYAILSDQPVNLYQQNKHQLQNSMQRFVPTSIADLSSLSRGAGAVARKNESCADNSAACNSKPLIESVAVCYYQNSLDECS